MPLKKAAVGEHGNTLPVCLVTETCAIQNPGRKLGNWVGMRKQGGGGSGPLFQKPGEAQIRGRRVGASSTTWDDRSRYPISQPSSSLSLLSPPPATAKPLSVLAAAMAPSCSSAPACYQRRKAALRKRGTSDARRPPETCWEGTGLSHLKLVASCLTKICNLAPPLRGTSFC